MLLVEFLFAVCIYIVFYDSNFSQARVDQTSSWERSRRTKMKVLYDYALNHLYVVFYLPPSNNA